MKHLTDVVIVGAGVIGCSIAYALRKQGIDVVVLDKNEVGAQASQAASGMLAPLKPFADPGDPYTQLLLASLARFPELVPELEDASGMCLAYQSTGTLRVMQTKRLSRLRTWVSTWRHQGFPVELLSDDEIRHYEPGLATDISLVLYNPHDPQLDALQLVRAYACAAERLGAMFYTHEEVNAVDHHHERILGVRTSQGKTIACTYLVLATGAWAAQSDWLGITLPVSPSGVKALPCSSLLLLSNTWSLVQASILLPRATIPSLSVWRETRRGLKYRRRLRLSHGYMRPRSGLFLPSRNVL